MLFRSPQVDLRGGAVVGVEALLRWTHPTRGVMPAGAFIGPAEETGVITSIGIWAVAQACADCKTWRRHSRLRDIRVAVNVSAVQLRQQDMPGLVAAELERHGLPPDCLELEIAEGAIIDHAPRIEDSLRALSDSGVAITFGDFGTGYASLRYLRTFPVTRLKIDRSFVEGIGKRGSDEAIARAVIGLARNLDLKVIAEGVETASQAEFLTHHGCDSAQGPFFAEPLSKEAFTAFAKAAVPKAVPKVVRDTARDTTRRRARAS